MRMKGLTFISLQLVKSKLGQPMPRKFSPFNRVFPRSGCHESYPHSLFDRKTILRIMSIPTYKNPDLVSQRWGPGYGRNYGETIQNNH